MKKDSRKTILSLFKTFFRVASFLVIVFLVLFSFTSKGADLWESARQKADLLPFPRTSETYPLSIHMIDVGKADAILIECDGEFALIDAGTYDSEETILNYLKQRKVDKLKFVFASHPDSDHIGGMSAVLDFLPVDIFIEPTYPEEKRPNTPEYQLLNEAQQRNQVKHYLAKVSDTFTLGRAELEVLGPVRAYKETNNNSLIIRLIYKDFVALFTGDMEKEAEADIIRAYPDDLQADVLKVSHHGSKTSTTTTFLDAVLPKYALISTGLDRNNLPNTSVLYNLDSVGAQIYRTDFYGNIICSYDNSNIIITTELEDE